MKFKKFLAAFLSAAMVAATVPVMHVFAAEVSTKTAFTMKADGDTGKGGIIWTRHYEFEDGSDPIDVETPKSVLEGRTFYSMGDCLDFMVKGYSDGPLNNIPYNKKTATLTNTYSLSPTASVTITVDTTNAEKQYESVIEAINKKVIFDGSESTGAILTEDEDAYVIHAKEINILNKSSRNGRAGSEQNPNMGKDYENNTFTFEKGMEIRNGAQVNIKADSTSDHKITAQMTLIFNKDLTVSSGGSLSISGYKMSTDIADHIPEHPFEHSTILKFAKSGEDDNVPSMNIEQGGKVSVSGSEVSGDVSPVVKNNGELEIVMEEQGYNAATQAATSSVVSTESEEGPAVKCEGDKAQITVKGGSTVTNANPDKSADAVDLAPGTKVKTEAGTTVIGEEPEGTEDSAYIDNNGNLILPHGGTKYAPDEEPGGESGGTPIPKNSLETPDGNIYTASNPEDLTKIASSVGLYFVKQEGSDRKYDIMLRAVSGDINKFNSAQFTFENKGAVDYVITPNTDIGISLIDAGDGAYEFNFDGKDGEVADTAQAIKLGEVEFTGYGKVDFSVKTTDLTLPNQAHATTTNDSLVTDFTAENGLLIVNGGDITVGDDTYLGKIADMTIEPDTQTVQINLMFPNNVETDPAKDAAYTNMTVAVNGGVQEGTAAPEPYSAKIELGTHKEELPKDVTVDSANFKYDSTADPQVEEIKEDPAEGANANGYKITLEVPVPEEMGSRYTFKFSGAGYRTYTVDAVIKNDPADEPHMINVWNNVMDHDLTVTASDGFEDVAAPITFLAGDIDNSQMIDLYDLSAAVAYFGKTNKQADGTYDSAYVQYDLNRDGSIDSKDIAMVLVSWNR